MEWTEEEDQVENSWTKVKTGKRKENKRSHGENKEEKGKRRQTEEANDTKDEGLRHQKEGKVEDKVEIEKKGKVIIRQDTIIIKGERYMKDNGKFILLTESQERDRLMEEMAKIF